MKLVVNRGLLIKAMGFVVEVANRHRLPILGNIKLVLDTHRLVLTASDLEVELTCLLALPEGACQEAGAVTVPADKLFSICKLLPEMTCVCMCLRVRLAVISAVVKATTLWQPCLLAIFQALASQIPKRALKFH